MQVIQPLGDKVLIRPDAPEELSSGGIILAAKKVADTGTVVAVSKDMEMPVSVGQKVRYIPNTRETLDDGTILLSEQHLLYIIG